METNLISDDQDVLRDSCAVFGCVAGEELASTVSVNNIIYLALMALQHRGQESSGMVVHDGNDFLVKKGMGLVSQVYQNGTDTFKSGHGTMGIGHNRYSTEGKSELINCQPFVVDTSHGKIAVAHNGEIVNAKLLRKMILQYGIGLSTGSDSELITQLLVREPPNGEPNGADWSARIRNLMSVAKCSYSLVIMTSDGIYGVRDPYGNRPLCVGEIVLQSEQDKNTLCNGELGPKKAKLEQTLYVVSSESCAFHSIGASLIRDVMPGEIIHLTSSGIESLGIVPRTHKDESPALCIFEYVYFARADSVLEGQLVYQVRQECGKRLAQEAYVDADIVSTVPESATPAAFGFAQESKIPYCEVLVKNRYVGRTFIQPSNRVRKLGVTTKFGPLTGNFRGKRIVLLDDSIVRGNTMGPIVKLLKTAGAKEVHIRVASPPLKHPCFMGINIPTREELIANRLNPTELAEHLGADSLVYLTIDGLRDSVKKGIEAFKKGNSGHCTACLTGDYPVELEW